MWFSCGFLLNQPTKGSPQKKHHQYQKLSYNLINHVLRCSTAEECRLGNCREAWVPHYRNCELCLNSCCMWVTNYGPFTSILFWVGSRGSGTGHSFAVASFLRICLLFQLLGREMLASPVAGVETCSGPLPFYVDLPQQVCTINHDICTHTHTYVQICIYIYTHLYTYVPRTPITGTGFAQTVRAKLQPKRALLPGHWLATSWQFATFFGLTFVALRLGPEKGLVSTTLSDFLLPRFG